MRWISSKELHSNMWMKDIEIWIHIHNMNKLYHEDEDNVYKCVKSTYVTKNEEET